MESAVKISKWWVRIKATLAAVAGLIGVAFIIFKSGVRSGRDNAETRERTKEKLARIDKQVEERDTDGLRNDGIDFAKRWDK